MTKNKNALWKVIFSKIISAEMSGAEHSGTCMSGAEGEVMSDNLPLRSDMPFPYPQSNLFMIRLLSNNLKRSVNLLQKYDAHHLMRKGHR